MRTIRLWDSSDSAYVLSLILDEEKPHLSPILQVTIATVHKGFQGTSTTQWEVRDLAVSPWDVDNEHREFFLADLRAGEGPRPPRFERRPPER